MGTLLQKVSRLLEDGSKFRNPTDAPMIYTARDSNVAYPRLSEKKDRK